MHSKFQSLKLNILLSTTSLVFALLITPSASWGQAHRQGGGHLPYIVTETEKGPELEGGEGKSTDKCQKPPKKVHFWGTLSGGESKDNVRTVKLKGPSYSGQIGVDYKINGFKVGAYFSEGYLRQKSPKTSLTIRSKAKTNSKNVYGYAAYYFSREFFANLLLGYSYNPTKSTRFHPGPIRADSKTNIYLVAPNLNYQKPFGNFIGSFKLGFVHTNSTRKKAITSTGLGLPRKKSHMNSANFLADIGYSFRNVGSFVNSIVPYIQGGIYHDYYQTFQRGVTGNFLRDQNSYLAGSGLRMYFKKDVTLSAGWTLVAGNTKRISNTATVTLRIGAF